MAKDEELSEVRAQEERREGAAQREARKKARIKREASKKALEAMRANDQRAFAEALRLMNVRENSKEWKSAWDEFHRHRGKP